MQLLFFIKTKIAIRVLSIPLSIVTIAIASVLFIQCSNISEIITIKTWEDLEIINTNPAGHFKLMRNLIKNSDDNSVNNNFTPILSQGNPTQETYQGEGFTGIFDGNGKSIEGIYVSASANFLGLFASVGNGAVIKNLTLKNITIQGRHFIGALAGEIKEEASIKNVQIMNAEISSSFEDGKNVGGIAGANGGELFVSFSGMVKGNENVGGVVGYNYGGIHTISYAVVQGKNNVGGLIGYNNGAIIGSIGMQSSSKSSGKKTSEQTSFIEGVSNIGGAVGYNEGSINTFVQADVKGVSNIGGIAGVNRNAVAGVFQGSVIGTTTTGGLIGENSGRIIGILNGSVINKLINELINEMALFPIVGINTANSKGSSKAGNKTGNSIVYWNETHISFPKTAPKDKEDNLENTSEQSNTTSNITSIQFSAVDTISRTDDGRFFDTQTKQSLFHQKAFQSLFTLPEASKQLPSLKSIDFNISDAF